MSARCATGPVLSRLGARARGAERAGQLAIGQDGGARRGARPGSGRDSPAEEHSRAVTITSRRAADNATSPGTVAATVTSTPVAFGVPPRSRRAPRSFGLRRALCDCELPPARAALAVLAVAATRPARRPWPL